MLACDAMPCRGGRALILVSDSQCVLLVDGGISYFSWKVFFFFFFFRFLIYFWAPNSKQKFVGTKDLLIQFLFFLHPFVRFFPQSIAWWACTHRMWPFYLIVVVSFWKGNRVFLIFLFLFFIYQVFLPMATGSGADALTMSSTAIKSPANSWMPVTVDAVTSRPKSCCITTKQDDW